MARLSKTQIDRLGARLKKGDITEEDLRLLDEYRRSFTEVYETVVAVIRNELLLQPTGRPAKSTTSISEKLRRESIRLTQIQDIAGCRVIVDDIFRQNEVVSSLTHVFFGATVSDRRVHPSHGYRAVHIIVNRKDKPVEIQVRTALQHLWAEQSEKLSDVVDPAIKYGGGADLKIQERLKVSSDLVAEEEALELDLAAEQQRLSVLQTQGSFTEEEQKKLATTQNARERVLLMRQRISQLLQDSIDSLPKKV